METSVHDQTRIGQRYPNADILHVFEVEWDEWEMDTTAWIIKPVNQDAILVMTDHGELCEEPISILNYRIEFYKKKLDTADAKLGESTDYKDFYKMNFEFYTSLINQTKRAKLFLEQKT